VDVLGFVAIQRVDILARGLTGLFLVDKLEWTVDHVVNLVAVDACPLLPLLGGEDHGDHVLVRLELASLV